MNHKKFKALILVPHFFKHGGVAMFYKSLRPYLNSDFQYFFRGNQSSKFEKLAFFYYFLDYINFFWILSTKKNDFFIINTSLAKSGCNRDAIFILILRLFRKKFIVFFHGWSIGYEKKVDSMKFPINQFKHASGIIVLAKDFKIKLKTWGFDQPIILGKTVVEESLIKGFSNDSNRFQNPQTFTFLFLSRIEKEKGIIETIEIFHQIQKSNPTKRFKLKIGGDGSYLNQAIKIVEEKEIKNIEFLGYLEGNAKRIELESAHFFLFPSYSEGMPLSVLEAMAFGLPILVTPVGSMKDIFENGKMGILLDNLDVDLASNLLNNLIHDEMKLIEISEFNYKYAHDNFLASVVADELNNIFLKFLKEK